MSEEEEQLSEEEIDERVIAQIDDPSAWEEPIAVRRDQASLDLKAKAWVTLCVLANLAVGEGRCRG